MVLRTAMRAVVIAVGTILVGIVGVMTGIWSLNVTLAVLLRSLFVMVLVLALTRAFRISDRQAADHADRPHQQVLIAAGVAYVLNLASWGGHALFGELLVSAAAFSALIDFALWMAVAFAGVRLGDRARAQASMAPVPYA